MDLLEGDDAGEWLWLEEDYLPLDIDWCPSPTGTRQQQVPQAPPGVFRYIFW